MKKWVFFDVMGVIFTVGDDTNDLLVPFVQDINKQITAEEILKEYRRASLGEISSRQFWQNVGLEEFYPDIETQYLDSKLTLDENCTDVLKKLKPKYNLGIISNDVSEWSCYLRKKYELNQYFDLIIISGDVHLRKPDEKIYQEIRKHNIEYKDCVFIDDRVKNLIAADKLGFKTILFDRENACPAGEYCRVHSFTQIETACRRLFGSALL